MKANDTKGTHHWSPGLVLWSNRMQTRRHSFLRMASSTRFLRVRRGQGTSRQKWTNRLFHRRGSHLRLCQVISSRYGSPQNFRLLTVLDYSLRYRVPSALGLSQASQAQHKIESILLDSEQGGVHSPCQRWGGGGYFSICVGGINLTCPPVFGQIRRFRVYNE